MGIVILAPGLFGLSIFENIGALYAFGSLLAFMFAHASILALRIKKPDLPRPFRIRGNIRIRGRDLPVTAILGLLATAFVWIIISITQPYSRWVGLAWMFGGLIIYYIYRRKSHLPLVNYAREPLSGETTIHPPRRAASK